MELSQAMAKIEGIGMLQQLGHIIDDECEANHGSLYIMLQHNSRAKRDLVLQVLKYMGIEEPASVIEYAYDERFYQTPLFERNPSYNEYHPVYTTQMIIHKSVLTIG